MERNSLLAALSAQALRGIALEHPQISLNRAEILVESGSPPGFLWFLHSGVCSTLVQMNGGESVGVALIGREGFVGTAALLALAASPFSQVMQIGGSASRIPIEIVRENLLPAEPGFRSAVLAFCGIFLADIAQNTACNRLHRIDQRLARWLLAASDRAASPVLALTHDLLAVMTGAYRPSVTNALAALERKGAIALHRGEVAVVDRAKLLAESCECYAIMLNRAPPQALRSCAVDA